MAAVWQLGDIIGDRPELVCQSLLSKAIVFLMVKISLNTQTSVLEQISCKVVVLRPSHSHSLSESG